MCPLRLSFHGAARSVTGSCFRLETDGGAILIDCGMFQGSKTEKELNYRPFPFRPDQIAAVLLTHAHIDHSGLLPKLVRAGFKGAIHATAPTVALCGVMLPDSAHIQEMEVEMLNRRNLRRRRDPVDPIYTMHDAEQTQSLFHPQPYDTWFQVIPGVKARLWNAGHLLGSASIEVEVAGDTGPIRLLFSGDIGPDAKLLEADPEGPTDIDYLICESTYGDTDREDASAERRRATLRDEVRAAINPNGALLIPSFAVERAQELISDLTKLMIDGDLPFIPIYVDSPLATKATRIFAAHAKALENGVQLVDGLHSHHVKFTETVEQSRALDQVHGFHIVIAASGMCDAGRIRHRLKNWIWRDEATVLLSGYQAEGSLGRIMEDGATAIRIQGEEYEVHARIRSIDLYSGHADGPELVQWIRERLPLHHTLFIVHGEEDAMSGLAHSLARVVPGEHLMMPALDDCFDLTADGAVRLASVEPPRLSPEQVARLDWHNDVSSLILDINSALRQSPDEKTRGVLIRRLRRALEDEASPSPPTQPRHPRHRRH